MPLFLVLSPFGAAVRTRAEALVLSLVLAATLTGCGGGERSTKVSPGGDAMSATAPGKLVCGLISRDLVRKVTGGDDFKTSGTGAEDAAGRATGPATCAVWDPARTATVMQVSVGEIKDADHWREQLASEASGLPDCRSYTGDPGVGYGCTYAKGTFRSGAGVYVLSGTRLIRATVFNWPDVTPEQRIALAEDLVRDLDKNVDAYDASH